MAVPLVCSIFCGNACVTANSRMLYAFSRDGAVPGSRWWKVVHPTFKAPGNAVWLVIVLCLILGLPSAGSYVAFAAITSVGVIGLNISYRVPILLRLLTPEDEFQRGPFSLGRWSKPTNAVAFLWVCFACVMFILPQVLPVTPQSLNYAPVAVGVVLVISVGWWLLGARHWFHGPVSNWDGNDSSSNQVGAKVEVSEEDGKMPDTDV